MNWGNFFAVMRERIGILIAAVILGALVAAPFVLSETSLERASVGVLVPGDSTLPGTTRIEPSELAIKLRDFAESEDLEDAVREELGEQARQLDDVTGDQASDLNTYRVEAAAENIDLAREAASAGAQILIDEGDRITEGLVQKLEEEFQQQAESLGPEYTEAQESVRELTFEVLDLRERVKELTVRINQLQNTILRAEAADVTRLDIPELEAAIKSARRERAPLNDRLREAVTERAEQSLDLRLLQLRRNALSATVQRAEGARLIRLASSSVLSGPTNASGSDLIDIAAKEAVAILIGLLVGIVILVLLERRRIFAR